MQKDDFCAFTTKLKADPSSAMWTPIIFSGGVGDSNHEIWGKLL